MVQAAGVNMNTWVLGNAPVGHYVAESPKAKDSGSESTEVVEKTFYMKARIMAGQPLLEGNALGLADYKWLSKDELEKQLHPRYWKAVKNMLASL